MRGFGQLEAVIMDIVWSADAPVSVREVRERLETQRVIAYTTVLTVMDNLHGKGWLVRQREGRAFRYQARMTREEYAARLMREALQSGEDHAAVFVRFLDDISSEESEALRAALRRRSRKRAR